MILSWAELAWDDYLYWQQFDKKILTKVNGLIKIIMRTPFEGIGKPEPLQFDLAGKRSRRVNDEHRLVYGVIETHVTIFQCRYHY